MSKNFFGGRVRPEKPTEEEIASRQAIRQMFDRLAQPRKRENKKEDEEGRQK